jgi:aspartate racemase
MSPPRELVVGVLGGMGPAATVDLLNKILAESGARSDQEHLHLIVDCDPKVPNRNEALDGTGPSPAPALVAMARRLEAAGADFLIMACNTAHAWEAEIRAAVAVPFVSILEETAAEVAAAVPPGTPCGVLAAGGCRRARLYERALEAIGRPPIVPDEAEQARFMDLLYRIKGGDLGAAVRAETAGLARALVGRGARLVIAGCTEVPLVLGAADCPVPLVDSSAALARATVAYARRQRPLPTARTAPGPAGREGEPACISPASRA